MNFRDFFRPPLALATALFLAGWGGRGVHGETIDFARDIRPALARACLHCHGPDPATRKARLRLDRADGLRSVVAPGNLEDSELWLRIQPADPDDQMPPRSEPKQLSAKEIALIRTWIEEGAQWTEHWAFEPPVRPDPPRIRDAKWSRSEIDRFVFDRLDSTGSVPAPRATREKLLRRLSFDLTGLPPTVPELEAFLADERPDAYERCVDRLLASPRYGENMAVRWLDGARFADSNGYQNDFGRSMSPWRDWVIRSYNENQPYDQFLTEQIAGDLLPHATDQQRIATGFQRNHRTTTEGGSIEEEWRIENVVDRVDTTATVFMGLTLSCARCHDHKYDPISQTEYYSLFAYFNNTTERGFYNETRGNVPPLIEVPTAENELRLAEFDRSISELEREIASARNDDASRFSEWIADLVAGMEPLPTPRWVLSLDRSLEIQAGATSTLARYTGETPVWADGPFGSAIVLDAKAATRVDLGSATDFDQDDEFSYAIWVKRGNDGAIFSKMDVATAYRGLDLILIQGRPTIHLIHSWPQNAIKVEAVREIPHNEWTHLAFSYDGSGSAQGLRIFVNGVEPERKVHSDTLRGTIRTAEPLRIGGRSTREFYQGSVRDLRVFDHVLSPDTARALARSELIRVAKTPGYRKLSSFHRAHVLEGPSSPHGSLRRKRKARQHYVEHAVPTAMVLKERESPRPTYVLDRGLYNAPDKSRRVEPGVPAFLPTLPTNAPSDRRALAAWLIDPAHPLTARVAVNQLWQALFGVGLVETSENFGLRGAPPSHPRLLDWLATEYVARQWDTKALLKLIVMSETYQQDSTGSAVQFKSDPHNRQLARGPRHRLPAEMIRDQALAIAGLLVERVGGPSVKPYQPDGMWQELAGGASQGPYLIGNGEDLYRRSLYTNRKRTVPHPTLSIFDAPSFEVCQVRRETTNTPVQALALLNDRTYVEAARHFALRMIENGPDAASRLTYGFRCATSRRPRPAELALLERGLARHLSTYQRDPAAARELLSVGTDEELQDPIEWAAYAIMASVLLNLDETVMKE